MPIMTDAPNEAKPQPEVLYGGEPEAGAAERRSPVARGEEQTTAAVLTGGTSLELVGGGAAVVLAIVGLAGYLSEYMAAIATIAIGGALLAHGAAVTARWSDTLRRAAADRRERFELREGIGSELFGGAAGIALGILALAGVTPFVLLAVAAIVLGAAVLLGAPVQLDLARLAPDQDARVGRVTYEAVEGSTSTMLFVSLGAVVLGILALIRVGPALTLVMVAMLALGGALFLGGSALTTRFARRLQQVSGAHRA